MQNYSTWIVEWKLTEGLAEMKRSDRLFSQLQVFAVYFDHRDNLLMREPLSDWKPEDWSSWLKKNGSPELYLTVVNDIIGEDGRTDFKNPDLVERLLATRESRRQHITALLRMLETGPFVGLEIDYERVKISQWSAFLDFCTELNLLLEGLGKKLRVVLEPRKECYAQDFPEGPEYVIMAYNLHGDHNGPGPRADAPFIRQLAGLCRKSMRSMPRIALAGGGYIWRGDGSVAQLTEQDAAKLAGEKKVVPARDAKTRYMVFSSPAEKSQNDIVWYADGETLAWLVRASLQEGFSRVALWRLEGNRDGVFEKLRGEM